jgi:hypothetical protein
VRDPHLQDVFGALGLYLEHAFPRGEKNVGEDGLEVRITHPELGERRMRDLPGILERFLDGYEITATRAVLVKRLD